jgi:hypothetical protein
MDFGIGEFGIWDLEIGFFWFLDLGFLVLTTTSAP